jgi:hypothetical protein
MQKLVWRLSLSSSVVSESFAIILASVLYGGEAHVGFLFGDSRTASSIKSSRRKFGLSLLPIGVANPATGAAASEHPRFAKPNYRLFRRQGFGWQTRAHGLKRSPRVGIADAQYPAEGTRCRVLVQQAAGGQLRG